MKKTIHKKAFASKPVAAAVGLAMGALVAANANAVSISNDGVGQVLMFPYYTVENGYNTNINITNTSNETVAFKIRFRESENSRDARDFNVILSPRDVWTASLTQNSEGGARLLTNDTTCTVGQLKPVAQLNQTIAGPGTENQRGIDFTNLDFINANADTGGTTLARTSSGHIEVIAMGTIPRFAENNPVAALADDANDAGLVITPNTTSIAYNAKHVNGAPRDCGIVADMFNNNLSNVAAQFNAPSNSLKGFVSFITPESGKALTAEPVVLKDFFLANVTRANLITAPESQAPGLHDVQPAVASWFEGNVEVTFEAEASSPQDAVSALLMSTGISNQYSVNPVTKAQTDWVITFPTKHYYVDERNPLLGIETNGYVHQVEADDADTAAVIESAALRPFSRTFQQRELTADDVYGTALPRADVLADVAGVAYNVPRENSQTACAEVGVAFNYFDREETPAPSEAGFSPAEPGATFNLCKEVEVLSFVHNDEIATFGESDGLFGKAVKANRVELANGFQNGWMSLDFTDSRGLPGAAGGTATELGGYPVIGFSATTLEAGQGAEGLKNWGYSAGHAYSRTPVVTP